MPNPQNSDARIKNRALYYLAKRDYSERELTTKLIHAFPDSKPHIALLIQELIAMDYLNNARFLSGRIRHRIQQGYGPEKISHELKEMHGFQKVEIKVILDELSESEEYSREKTLDALIEKKQGLDLSDPKAKARIMRSLSQRGFQYDDIKSALLRFKRER